MLPISNSGIFILQGSKITKVHQIQLGSSSQYLFHESLPVFHIYSQSCPGLICRDPSSLLVEAIPMT